jgi:anhydro-N-acetylmuramic acid kinase
MDIPKRMNILGIMSGTSMDGLDLAVCSFEEKGGNWTFRILYTEIVAYDENWTRKLATAPHLSGPDLHILDREFGQFIADHASSIIASSGIKTELIASHGHTLFHQPEASFSLQIGNPQVIASMTGIRCVGDFRQLDMLHGGQGAPLVPVGDEHLFGEYDFCLNLGGFANISFKKDGKRLARDVCPANTVLNHFARELGLPFDHKGKAGRSGNLSSSLLDKLNEIPYYRMEGPGSLAREWLESDFLPMINEFRLPVTDVLRTLTEHVSYQIARQTRPHSQILVTGGGAYNEFLMERIMHHSKSDIVIPSSQLVEFKEALVFAFLGLLRILGEINCYASVTGADRDCVCGVVYLP